ncbi:MAG: cytochrome c biogenesis protein CcdA [Chloroflexota bacterium]
MDAANSVTFGLAFVAGFLSFISPCVLPLLPAYISYLGARAVMEITPITSVAPMSTGGVSTVGLVGGMGGVAAAAPVVRSKRLGTFVHGLFFVAGFTFVFVTFGILGNVGIQLIRAGSYNLQIWITRIGGLLIIFFGLHVLGFTGWTLRKLISLFSGQEHYDGLAGAILNGLERIQALLYGDTRQQMNPRNGYGYAGSALMGVIFAAGWTPCVGPIYGAILTMAATISKTNAWTQPAILLFAYSLGLGLPFLIAALALDRMRGLLKRLQRQMRLIEIVTGVFLITVGFLLLTDQFTYLNQAASGIADFSYNLEECTIGVLRNQIPAGDYGACMKLGTDYKDAPQTRAIPTQPLVMLADGRVLLIAA